MTTIKAPALATIATPAAVVRAIAFDAAAWVVPFVVAALASIFIPAVAASAFLTSMLFVGAFAFAAISFARAALTLARFGYTPGLRRRGLRVIDTDADVTLYKARLLRKNIFRLLAGRYEVIAL